MTFLVGLRELRENVAKYAKQVQSGQSFIVMKHSKPLFKITPLDEGGRWEEAINFTKVKQGGIDIDELLTRL